MTVVPLGRLSSRVCNVFRVTPVGSKHLRRLHAPKDSLTPSMPLDPAEALRSFYGEEDGLLKDDCRRAEEARSFASKGAMSRSNPRDLSIQSIVDMIAGECNAEITQYAGSSSRDAVTIVLQLETSRERVALAETLVKRFRPLLGGDEVSYDGLYSREPRKRRGKKDAAGGGRGKSKSEEVDWIVIDLRTAIIHIFSPDARLAYGLDAKFKARELGLDDEGGVEVVFEKLCNSLPRKIAGDPMRSSGAAKVTNPFTSIEKI